MKDLAEKNGRRRARFLTFHHAGTARPSPDFLTEMADVAGSVLMVFGLIFLALLVIARATAFEPEVDESYRKNAHAIDDHPARRIP